MLLDDEICVGQLHEVPIDGLGILMSTQGKSFNFFRHRMRLAIVQSRIYSRLYSLKSQLVTDAVRLQAVQELEAELAEWKADIPEEFQAVYIARCLPPSELRHLTILYSFHFYCPAKIHGVALNDTIRLRSKLEPAPQALCLSSARECQDLLRDLPRDEYTCMRPLLSAMASAANLVLRAAVDGKKGDISEDSQPC